MGSEQSLSEMVKQAQAEAGEPVVEQEVVQEQQEVAAEGEGGTEAASTPVVAKKRDFIDYLAEKGYEVEGADPEDLYSQAESRIGYAAQLEQQLAELKAQLNARQPTPAQEYVAPVAPAPQPAPAGETAAQAIARKLAALNRPDEVKYRMVEQDPATRTYRPLPEYGAEAINAANEINNYQAEESRRAAALLQDPLGLMGDDIRTLAQEQAKLIFEQQMEQWKQQQEQERQAQLRAQEQATYSQRVEKFYEANKSRLFILDGNGEPRKLLGSNAPSLTVTGQKYSHEFEKLRQRLPGVDDVTIMELALELATATPPAPAQTPEQKREQFSAQARTQSTRIPSQNTNVAPLAAQQQFNRPLRFSDMIALDGDNADNPAIDAIRTK